MINYTTDFLCTYHLIEDLDDSNILYQQQFLQAFGLADQSTLMMPIDNIFKVIDEITEELYNNYKNNIHIQKLMEAIGNYNNDNIRFQMCFSYDYFYIMHNLLCKIITNIPLEIKETINLINKIKLN
tara:strand:- start:1074 stop:1454 length:381 start_codon:yes stop_codon:yes gene_type:complete